MVYKIKARQRANAKKLGLTIKPSTNPKKKLDVFNKDGKRIARIGGMGYGDYASFISERGMDYANERRRLYKIRHNKTRMKAGTNSFYADKILWD